MKYIHNRLDDNKSFSRDEGERFEVSAFPIGSDDDFTLDPINAHGIRERQRQRRDWLVEGVAVAGQPLVCGGPSKTLKTSIMVDLAVSVGTGTPFLGRFRVPRKRMVLMLSGESDQATISETHDRIWAVKGIDPDDLDADGYVVFDFKLPQLANRRHLQELKRIIINEGAELLIVDPMYLCLRGATLRDSTDMGDMLKRFADMCLAESCTPGMVQHDRRGTAGKPELANLAHAGIEEFARQWLLVGRRKQYQPGSGVHQLWMSIGGSAGHAATFAVEVDEGRQQLDFAGRKWAVKVMSEDEAESQDAERRDAKRQARQLTKDEADDAAFLAKLDHLNADGQGVRQREFRTALKWGPQRIRDAIARLVGNGLIEVVEREFVKTNGRAQAVSWVKRNADSRC